MKVWTCLAFCGVRVLLRVREEIGGVARDLLDTAPREAGSAREAFFWDGFVLRRGRGLLTWDGGADFLGLDIWSALCFVLGSASFSPYILRSLIYLSPVSRLVPMII